MLLRNLAWRTYTKDRIFTFLTSLALISLIIALMERRPAFERSPIPFELAIFFTVVNALFAFLSLKREPLLAYMFLATTILLNGSLYFYFRYLLLIQGV